MLEKEEANRKEDFNAIKYILVQHERSERNSIQFWKKCDCRGKIFNGKVA